MPNEFVTRNGFISLNSSQITGSLTVTQGVTASLFGTSSWSSNAVTSSNSLTASFVLQAVSASFATSASFAQVFPFTGSAIISGSLQVTGSTFISGGLTVFTGSGIEFQVAGTGVTIGNVTTDSHTITGSLNSVPINSYVLAASGGFSKSFAIINNNNISAADVGIFPVWRCNVPCTASQVLGYTDSGSAVLVNATRNGSALLASDLSISTDTWVSSSTLQNQNFNTGDILAFRLVSFSSTPKEITIQTSFIY